jgi:hypothetical protein
MNFTQALVNADRERQRQDREQASELTEVRLDEQTVLKGPFDLSDPVGGQAIFAVVFEDTGEIREQLVDRLNLHPTWTATVAKRAAKIDRNELTPHSLVPRK